MSDDSLNYFLDMQFDTSNTYEFLDDDCDCDDCPSGENIDNQISTNDLVTFMMPSPISSITLPKPLVASSSGNGSNARVDALCQEVCTNISASHTGNWDVSNRPGGVILCQCSYGAAGTSTAAPQPTMAPTKPPAPACPDGHVTIGSLLSDEAHALYTEHMFPADLRHLDQCVLHEDACPSDFACSDIGCLVEIQCPDEKVFDPRVCKCISASCQAFMDNTCSTESPTSSPPPTSPPPAPTSPPPAPTSPPPVPTSPPLNPTLDPEFCSAPSEADCVRLALCAWQDGTCQLNHSEFEQLKGFLSFT